MALFQNSVRKKYIAAQDHQLMQGAFEAYRKYFHNPQIHTNIRAAKEEQFQEGFLRELFVNILGYTINPNPDYNLTTELKNVRDAKKTDGAILKDGNALAVIELKGTDTKDLEKIRDQAFNYKNNQPECRYVITSNFEKLRFYIDNAIDFVEFNVFAMQWEDFTLCWLLLQKDNLLGGLPKKVKEESLIVEELITKQLYADYSSFKQQLWQDTVAQNPGQDELELYKKSQKLLDRFLFIFFAEDKGLLPPNSIMEIVKQWSKLKELDAYTPLYERFIKYFGYLNTGRIQPGKVEIHAYNGGLFAPDPILDALKISDTVLEKHVQKLTEYDFESEVDTNILGHIFEHSLNDIENVRAQLAGQDVDKSKTKRKRDGVFYTPKYITKYIVDNTLGRLCEEKKKAYEIVDEDFAEGKRGRQKKTIQRLKEKLDQYRGWLLQLTICDPACGSGAFLNQVLEFLMSEHRYIDELESQLFASPLILPNVENHILENNIFGVDINEESVEIARLSLWLRTAKKGRKLSSLNSNIKVGNSLIDDPEIAGDLAFNWEKEFPKVFDPSLRGTKQSGFDVVVGNPPYVRADSPGNDLEFRNFLTSQNRFKTLKGKWDLYIPFVELSLENVKKNGIVSLIIPDAYCHAEYATLSLETYVKNNNLFMIDYFPEIEVFKGVGVKSVIVNFRKNSIKKDYELRVHIDEANHNRQVLYDYPTNFRIDFKESLIANSKFKALAEIFYISVGIVGNSDEKHFKGEFLVGDLLSEDKDDNHPRLYFEGKDIDRNYLKNERWIEYGNERSPSKWRRKGFSNFFLAPKIVTMRSPGKEPRSLIDTSQGFFNESAIGFVRWYDLKGVESTSLKNEISDRNLRSKFEEVSKEYSLDFLLAIMNSSLLKFELNSNRRSNIHIYPDDWRKLNLPPFTQNIGNLGRSNRENTLYVVGVKKRFVELLQSKFSISKPSTKLQNWPSLDFKGFLGELKKAKVKLSLAEEADWMAYFNEQKAKALELQNEITRIDQEIDQLVYELYGLTEEEIRVVEGGER